MKLRILHVIGNLGLGGAQSVLYHLWPSLCRSYKYNFEICVLNSLGHFGELLISEGATIHCLKSKHKYDPTAIFNLRRIIKNESYKILHAHLFPELCVAALAAAGIHHVHLVYTEHPTYRRRKMGIACKLLDRLAYHSYDRIIAVNSSTHRNLITWLPELARRSIIIPNAVRLDIIKNPIYADKLELLKELSLKPSSGIQLILFAGRLIFQKGIDVLLLALSQVKRSDYLCLIAGSGPERGRLEELVELLALHNRVHFLGTRSDIINLLSLVDFLVLPSRSEGLPLIILEAMAAGCPIIATSVDGIAEILHNEVSGLLVPPNDPDALGNAIQRFLDAPHLRSPLAKQATIDVQAYSADKIAGQLLAVYDEILEKASESL